MQLGMIGLGRMGANLVRRLMNDGHQCVVFDQEPAAAKALTEEGATGADSVQNLVAQLTAPRAVWVMVPSGAITDSVINSLATALESGDIIIDGGNSFYRDDLRRAKELSTHGIRLLDCGTSGGVWGLHRGYSLMIGGDADAVAQVKPVFATIAPGVEAAGRTPGRDGDVADCEQGFLHCGPNGAGHFVKMVHNGIEYGMMAAIAEGLNILHKANIGATSAATNDVETAPLADPEYYRYDLDLAQVSEVWRRGSVIGSWLVDLSAVALRQSPDLSDFTGRVSDSGEGRWTAIAAIEEGVPAPVLTAALDSRFDSRSLDEFADQALSAMRKQFGGHDEKAAT
ncbi:6-phosphogluconate dehydrogenase (decarboxylating) [Humibacillus sp. DSM 29435]|uniref:phosphogluconate dehydrogenase (NAD(+)-dependent, decarboxylating) n=1 Tax=Humibacillus sp. DSM 29435 TaxID=1869167 RepID=UPI000872732D|nr:decarboxylating 6-phosphogluconate dehydrogenase [Humibacillus sp. DSM 29435]OFE18368.1 6-phosphogluconate dehydrogenase (decarboxylating) [Humibacillus sp. DSM 29435]